MTQLVLREVEGGVTRLTLNDAVSRNSLSLAMMDSLQEELKQVSTNVVILAGAGPAFCAGHNLKEITSHRQDNDLGQQYFDKLFGACGELMMSIVKHPAAIVAEVDGIASAAGCQIVASCDLAVASERASFCTPGVNIGLFCSTPMVALSRAVPRKHAMEMLLTGEMVGAQEAFRIGLVNRVVSSDKLRSTTTELAQRIATKSPEAISLGKRAFVEQENLPLTEAYAAMAKVMAENLMCGDAREGISAFIEKRKPKWTSA